jgi:hypothetical protein
MLEPNETCSPEDKALIAYVNEHHEIDLAMRVVAGNGPMNDVCAAYRAGAKWQRSQVSKSHYVECHVIVAEDPKGECLPHAKTKGWWGSRLEEDGSEEEKSGDLILTTRRETPEDAVDSIRLLAADLTANGFKVTRGKTEIVTYDTKLGDEL